MDELAAGLFSHVKQQLADLARLIVAPRPATPETPALRFTEGAETVLGNLASVVCALVLLLGALSLLVGTLDRMSGGVLVGATSRLPPPVKLVLLLAAAAGLLAGARLLLVVSTWLKLYRVPAIAALLVAIFGALRALALLLHGGLPSVGDLLHLAQNVFGP